MRLAAASLNGCKVRIDFTGDKPSWTIKAGVESPLAILKGVNHATVRDPQVCLKLVLQCLAVTDGTGYSRVRQHFQTISQKAQPHPEAGPAGWLKRLLRLAPAEGHHAFQQLVFRLVDAAGVPVPDYRLEFSVVDRRTGRQDASLTAWLDDHVVQHVHTYGDDRSLRAFYIDVTDIGRLERRLGAHRDIVLSLSVEDLDRNISYLFSNMKRFPVAGVGAPAGSPSFFMPNVTTLVELVVERGTVELVRLRWFRLS